MEMNRRIGHAHADGGGCYISKGWRCQPVLFVLLLLLSLGLSFSLEAAPITYRYDELGRLIQVIYGDGTTIRYTYDAAGNRLTQQVSRGPDIRLSASSLNFGQVVVGTSKDLSFTVFNDGDADLTVSDLTLASGPFSVVSPTVPFTVAAGSSQDVSVRFSPTAAGVADATLRVISDDPDEGSLPVSLLGEGLLVTQPMALLSLNQTSFHPGDPLRVEARLLTPATVPPAGAYLFEAKFWLRTPLPFPWNLIAILNIAGPGQAVALPPGIDQIVELLNVTLPTDLPAGSYEFGLRLRHPTTGEELSVSLAPFEVSSAAAASRMKRPQPKALQRLVAAARKGLNLPGVFSAPMPRSSDNPLLAQGLGAVRKGRAKGSLGPRVYRAARGVLVAQPTAHLSLNGASFRVGDPLQLDVQLLMPTEIPPAGNYAFELKLWLETPMAFPVDLISIFNIAGPGPGGIITLPPGFDQTFRVIDTAVPAGISTGAYEFGVRLLHPVTGEELSTEVEPFNVTE